MYKSFFITALVLNFDPRLASYTTTAKTGINISIEMCPINCKYIKIGINGNKVSMKIYLKE